MTTNVTLTIGDTSKGRQYPPTAAGVQAAVDAIPANLVTSDVNYYIEFYNDRLVDFGNTRVGVYNKTTGPNNRITFRAATGQGFRQHPTAATNPYRYDQTFGVAINFSDGYNTNVFDVYNTPYVTFEGLQIGTTGGSDGSMIRLGNDNDGFDGMVIDSCILKPGGSGTYVNAVLSGAGLIRNTLIICDSNNSNGIDPGLNKRTRVENCTIVRPSDFAAAGTAINAPKDGNVTTNTALFGFQVANGQANYPGDMVNNGMDLPLFGTGKGGLVYANQFVNTTRANADFRTKTGSDLINAGVTPAADNVNAPVGARRQGTAADIGSWEFAESVQSPSATITNIAVSGQSVTISGTTTGTPTSGSMSLAVTATTGNNGVAPSPVTLTLGTNTFTATFSNLKVGRYTPAYTVTNSAYTSQGMNSVGNVDIVGAYATSLIQDALNGQVLTIHGNTAGSPTSGSITVPAAASNPNGAVDQQSTITLGTGTFTVSVSLPPGNYDPSLVSFTNAAGTSLPQPGTSAVQVTGISGNPQAPGSGSSDTTAPVMTGSLTNSSILPTGYTLNWPAATDNVAVTGYEVSTDGGTTYTDVGNTLTRVITGKSQNTTYNNRVRAYDAAGNRATPLSNTATTQSAADTTAPVMQGSLTSSNITQTGYTLNWQAATDDTAVTGYEVSTDGGTTYVDVGNVLTRAVSGKTAATTYSNRVRAYDAAGNRATPLSNNVTTASHGSSTASTAVILTVAIGAQYRANLQGMQWYWYDKLSPFGTPVDQGDASAITANGTLAINMPDSSKGSGDLGWLVVTDLDDRTGIPFKVFSGIVRIN